MSKELNIGWREWVSLPDISHLHFRAKIDTGAKTSALHARDLQLSPDGTRVHFKVKGEEGWEVLDDIEVVDHRIIRSSNGKVEDRPVILTKLRMGGREWEVHVTLTNRKSMKYRMLIGREALEGRTIIHPGSSYLLDKEPTP